jgi:hypothetical protein
MRMRMPTHAHRPNSFGGVVSAALATHSALLSQLLIQGRCEPVVHLTHGHHTTAVLIHFLQVFLDIGRLLAHLNADMTRLLDGQDAIAINIVLFELILGEGKGATTIRGSQHEKPV